MNKQQTIERAKVIAARENKTVLVLNLNRYSPLYVIRDYDERLLFSDSLVAVVEPCGGVA